MARRKNKNKEPQERMHAQGRTINTPWQDNNPGSMRSKGGVEVPTRKIEFIEKPGKKKKKSKRY